MKINVGRIALVLIVALVLGVLMAAAAFLLLHGDELK